MAHNAGGSLRSGIKDEKLAAVWEFRTSPLFDARERVALEFAIAAASQPNAVTDELFARMKQYWSEPRGSRERKMRRYEHHCDL